MTPDEKEDATIDACLSAFLEIRDTLKEMAAVIKRAVDLYQQARESEAMARALKGGCWPKLPGDLVIGRDKETI